jgi:chromosome segregation ATPase
LHTVHGKQREFTTELVAILQREALLQNAKLNKANNDLIKEKGKLEKKLKASNEKLEDIRVNNEKVEQLKKDYTLNITTLSNCEQQIGKLQSELKEARETAAQLQSTVESDSHVEVLREALDKETKLTTQLKTALESKQREIRTIEENSLEANSELEESVKSYKENLQSSKKQCENLQGEITLLKKKLNSVEQLNVQITETKDKTENSLKTVTFQFKGQSQQLQIVTTEVNDLKINKKNLEQKIDSLHLIIKDLAEREKVYLETEELYEQNFRDIADKTNDTTQFLEELRNSGDLNKSLHQEINSKETQTT